MKVKVIKMNFTKKLQEALGDSILGMFSKAGADLNKLPDEQVITLNTKYIVEIDEPLPQELSQGAFTVKLAVANEGNPCVYIKNECYQELYDAWCKDE